MDYQILARTLHGNDNLFSSQAGFSSKMVEIDLSSYLEALLVG